MEKSKYPKLIKLENGAFTFRNADGTRWEKEFALAHPFSEGLAVVRPDEKSFIYRFVDRDGDYWGDEVFEFAEDFKNGLARVWPVGASYYTFIDHDKNIWEEGFEDLGEPPYEVSPGLFRASDYKTGKLKYFDLNHNFYTKEQADILEKIYLRDPKIILNLKTADFKDGDFVELMGEAVKGYLTKEINNRYLGTYDEELDDKFVNDTEKLLDDIKEKVAKERAVIENRNEMLMDLWESVDDFSL